MDTNRVSFLKKMYAIYFGYLGRKKFKDNYIKCSPFITFVLLTLNMVYILGGWVFVAHYFDKFFNFEIGYASSLLTLITWIMFNIVYIYFTSCEYEHKK